MKIRRLTVVMLALLMVAATPHDRTAPNRWALLVGISDYVNFGDEIGGDLPGAAWDARRMRDVLVSRWGFDADRVRLVLDTDATRARIERELTEWLPSVVKEGDVVVFFFAGHGSQAWDLDGDEDDGLDETICPTDVLKGDASRDIRDDELNEWLGRVPTEVVVIMDNCHAGTGTRAVTPFSRPRALARNVASDLPRPDAAESAGTRPERGGMTAEAGAPRNVLEIAAAQADEVAVDAEWPGRDGTPSTYGGAFTTTMVRHLWRVPRRTSYEEIFHLTAADLKRQRFAQRPLLTRTGAEARAFAHLDGASAASTDEASVPVTGVTGATVRLGGGAAAGITVGSLYRAGDALLRVTEVRDDAAVAELASGPTPRRGTSARLAAFAYPQTVLRVSLADVDAATRGAVTRAAAGTSTLHFTTSPREFAHLIVRPAENGYVILGMDGATRHHVTGADRSASARAVVEELRSEAGAHQLAVLDNPGQTDPLAFSFRGERTTFDLGDEVGFRVRAERDGYLTLVDLGTDGRITVLFPTDEGEDGFLAAGTLFELPSGDYAYEAQEPTGRGIVRAFLTDRPMDLRFDDARPERASAVMAALRRAAGEPPVAGAAVPTDTWLTAAIVYTIGH